MKPLSCLTALLVLIAVVTVPPARAAALTNADAVLHFALGKNDDYKSFTADFSQKMVALGTEMHMQGTVEFKRPAMMRMEMAIPLMNISQQMLVVMGPDKIMWQQVSMGGSTNFIKVDFQTIPTNNPAIAAFQNPLDTADPKLQLKTAMDRFNFTLLPALEKPEQPLYVLEGVLKPDAKPSPQEIALPGGMGPQKIYIGQQDGFLHRIEQLDKSGTNSTMSIEFTNLKLNPPLADSRFVFTPPANGNIIDMTQMLLKKMQVSGGTDEKPVKIVSPDNK